MKPAYFKPWINNWHWGIRIALLLILLSALMQLGLFALTGNYIVSYLGAQPEDVSFCLLSTYSGIIAVLPLQFRLLRYFEIRGYLIINILLAILLNCLCIGCRDITLLFVIRFLQGILVGSINVSVLILIFSRVPTERAQLIGSAVFYPAILGNVVLVALIAAVVLDYTDWKATYYCLIWIQLLTLVIALLMLRRHAGHRRFPLYQLDWAGAILLAVSLLGLAYTFIYGSAYYWFADPRICFSGGVTVAGILLFVYRQSMLKRPLIHLGIFKSVHFITGLCLLGIFYGGKDSINLVYSYAFGTLKWRPVEVITLGVCNIGAMAGLSILATRLIMRKIQVIRYLLVTGFGLLGLFNVWMWFVLTPDLSFTDLIVPMLIQGAAAGLLFVPIIIYVLTSAPGYSGTSGLVMAACTRFTATVNSLAGLYNLQLYYNQYFREGFLGRMTADDQNTVARLNTYQSLYVSKGYTPRQGSGMALNTVWQHLGLQSQLLTSRAVFMTFALLLLSAAVLILFVPAAARTWKYVIHK